MTLRRRTAVALAAVAAVAVTALVACAPTPTGRPAQGGPGGAGPGGATDDARTLVVDGLERTYRVHVPARLDGDPGLVVMLHGGLGSGAQAQRAYGWDAAAEAGGFVVAYPDGLDRTWNAGDCCGGAARDDVDDVAFLTALVASLQDEFDVAADRTFATGMSNGAMMTYRLACETDLFAAVAPVAGTLVAACDDPRPVSLLHVHGMLDTSVPFDGSPGDGVGRVDGMPVPDAIDAFRGAAACDAPVVTEDPPLTTATSVCADDRVVTLVTVADADHSWPEGTTRRVVQFFGL